VGRLKNIIVYVIIGIAALVAIPVYLFMFKDERTGRERQQAELEPKPMLLENLDVKNNFIVYDGESPIRMPINYDFCLLSATYRGANRWRFIGIFFVLKRENNPIPTTRDEIKDVARLIFIQVENVTEPERLFAECVQTERLWFSLGRNIKKGDIKNTCWGHDGYLIMRICDPNTVCFFSNLSPVTEYYILKLFGTYMPCTTLDPILYLMKEGEITSMSDANTPHEDHIVYEGDDEIDWIPYRRGGYYDTRLPFIIE
jgi:hypothetical protein